MENDDFHASTEKTWRCNRVEKGCKCRGFYNRKLPCASDFSEKFRVCPMLWVGVVYGGVRVWFYATSRRRKKFHRLPVQTHFIIVLKKQEN